MSDRSIESVNAFQQRLRNDEARGTRLIVKVFGGTPGDQRIEKTIIISDGRHIVAKDSSEKESPVQEGVMERNVEDLLREVVENREGLQTREQAKFLPDSVVASVILETDEGSTELFFLVDEEDRATQNFPIKPEASRAFSKISELGDQILGHFDRGRQ